MLLLTLDTNLVDPAEIDLLEAKLANVPHEFAFIGVTEREHGFEIGYGGQRVNESMDWGESPWGSVWGGPKSAVFVLDEAVLAPDDASVCRFDVLGDGKDVLQSALDIIGDGSFPQPGHRDELSDGERRQLRDAMIFDAHVRECRHVLVSNDQKAYVNHGKREKLERLGATKIRTTAELIAIADGGTLDELLPSE